MMTSVSQRMPWTQVSEPSATILDVGSLIEKRANVCIRGTICRMRQPGTRPYGLLAETVLVPKNRRGECIRSYNHSTSKIKYLHTVFWILCFSHRVGADRGTITQGMALPSRMIRIPFATLVYISDSRTKEVRIFNTSAIATARLQTYLFTLSVEKSKHLLSS